MVTGWQIITFRQAVFYSSGLTVPAVYLPPKNLYAARKESE